MSDDITNTVRPLKSLVSWVGGKRRLALLIVKRIEAVPHELYAEPFIGMGSVFLARTRRARFEVINDRLNDVVNLFRVAKHHPTALVEELRFALVSRADFSRLIDTPPEIMTDVQRAARFFYLQRLNYGGKPGDRSFPTRGHDSDGIARERLIEHLLAVRDRLARVTIENMDWSELLRRYDRPEALFYIDPPYFGCENYYGQGLFVRDDHARLAEALLALKGRFILSINDHPTIRALYEGRAEIEQVRTIYSIAGRAGPRAVGELLISGGGAAARPS
jgi:DNA adenine methylase